MAQVSFLKLDAPLDIKVYQRALQEGVWSRMEVVYKTQGIVSTIGDEKAH